MQSFLPEENALPRMDSAKLVNLISLINLQPKLFISKENSSLFLIFILAIEVLSLVPYTIHRVANAAWKKARSIHCHCSVYLRSGKYRTSVAKKILKFSTSSEAEIKKAYRRLSIQHHPDPEANKYFVEYISKSYQALTNPVARENLQNMAIQMVDRDFKWV